MGKSRRGGRSQLRKTNEHRVLVKKARSKKNKILKGIAKTNIVYQRKNKPNRRRNKVTKKTLNEQEEELGRLEKFLFADPLSILDGAKEEKDNELGSLEISPLIEKKTGRRPAWEDEDDQNIPIETAFKDQGRPGISHPGKPMDLYSSLLKTRFENIVGKPKWAELNQKKVKGSDDEESEDEDDGSQLLQRCGNIIRKQKTLKSHFLKHGYAMLINKESMSEGKNIKAVEFHPTTKMVLVAGSSGTASLFKVKSKDCRKLQSVKFGPRNYINCARFLQNGDQFIVGYNQLRRFSIFDMMKDNVIHVPIHHATGLKDTGNFEVSPDGKFIAVIGKFGEIFLFSAATREWIKTLKEGIGDISKICFNSDGSKMYSITGAGEVQIWDMNKMKLMHKFNDEGSFEGTSISVSPDKKLLSCGSSSGVVNVYDTDSLHSTSNPKPLKSFFNLTTSATTVKFNHTSQLLCMASKLKDKSLKMAHFPSMTVYANFPLQSNIGCVNTCSFSPNSGFVGIGSNISRAYIFRLNYFWDY